MARVAGWTLIIQKNEERLAKWKIPLLYIGARSMLLKAILGSLGIYFLSIFFMPTTVKKYLESLRSYFFWGFADVKKFSWVKWDLVMASKDKGGLDIDSKGNFNHALLQKNGDGDILLIRVRCGLKSLIRSIINIIEFVFVVPWGIVWVCGRGY